MHKPERFSLSDTDKLTAIIDLIEDVVYEFDRYVGATFLTDQANHLNQLANHMSDLRTWHPGYDYETGTMPWERDEEVS